MTLYPTLLLRHLFLHTARSRALHNEGAHYGCDIISLLPSLLFITNAPSQRRICHHGSHTGSPAMVVIHAVNDVSRCVQSLLCHDQWSPSSLCV